jgi:DNA polymerase elongation subunit (family B)
MDPKFDNLPGVEYEQFGQFRFAQNVPSLLPAVLGELKQFRKQAKKDMARAEGTPMRAVYDGKQLAYKISMNSVYGFTGASKGMLPLVAIASTVTMRGRQMIEETKNYVEANFPGANVRYGDSVMPYTKVRVSGILDNGAHIKDSQVPIENLGMIWKPYPGFMKAGTQKQQSELSGQLLAMTHMGWRPIRRVIRHKCGKKIYLVKSQWGSVEVTEDHSLLDNHLKLLKPSEIKIDTSLLHCEDGTDSGVPIEVKVLHESWTDWVYDLETDAGTFQAGEGSLIVKNTDSVMVEFDVGHRKGQEAIDYSWKLGEEAAEQCTRLFKAPNDLELEKVYCPYFLYSKKRYAAKMYEGASDKNGIPILKDDGTRLVKFKKIDVKGLQVVRRDNCPYVREVCKEILGLILGSNDPLPAIQKARQAAKDLKAGEVPMEKLMMSKQLGADYKSKSLAHVAVVGKMRERAPGSEPQQGDRVPFVIVQGPRNAKMFEKAEDPQYVRDNNLRLDYNYYFENQLKNPVCDLLEPLVGDTNVIFEKPTKKITDFFSKPI